MERNPCGQASPLAGTIDSVLARSVNHVGFPRLCSWASLRCWRSHARTVALRSCNFAAVLVSELLGIGVSAQVSDVFPLSFKIHDLSRPSSSIGIEGPYEAHQHGVSSFSSIIPLASQSLGQQGTAAWEEALR